jgi:hypothetical protein
VFEAVAGTGKGMLGIGIVAVAGHGVKSKVKSEK